MKRLTILGSLYLLCSSILAQAEQITLAKDAPSEYVVVKGDTLWDISARFLKSPWLWPKVWEVNAQIYNPHLIYPGDIIYLYFEDGQPKLSRKPGTVVLTPEVKVVPRQAAITSLPLRDLKAFLDNSHVVSADIYASAPYVLGGKNQRILAAKGDRIYARGELPDNHLQQTIYRPLTSYIDPNSQEILGYELHRVADARVVNQEDDLFSLDVINNVEEVRLKDLVMTSAEVSLDTRFIPQPGAFIEDAEIIAVLNGVSNIGQFDSVTLNVGARESVVPGDVYAIYGRGEKIRDPKTEALLQLPSERSGELMIYKVFEKVSYALVMRATDTIKVGDELRVP